MVQNVYYSNKANALDSLYHMEKGPAYANTLVEQCGKKYILHMDNRIVASIETNGKMVLRVSPTELTREQKSALQDFCMIDNAGLCNAIAGVPTDGIHPPRINHFRKIAEVSSNYNFDIQEKYWQERS